MPALFMIYKFGAANAGSVAGRPGDLPRNTAGAWLFYAEQMPSQLGYATVALAIAALILAASNRLRLERWSLILLGVWFVIGYILFSLISVREPRHDLMILFPVILLAGMAPVTISKCRPWGSAAVLLLGLGTYSYSVVLYPPPVVAGYQDVALHARRAALSCSRGTAMAISFSKCANTRNAAT